MSSRRNTILIISKWVTVIHMVTRRYFFFFCFLMFPLFFKRIQLKHLERETGICPLFTIVAWGFCIASLATHNSQMHMWAAERCRSRSPASQVHKIADDLQVMLQLHGPMFVICYFTLFWITYSTLPIYQVSNYVFLPHLIPKFNLNIHLYKNIWVRS